LAEAIAARGAEVVVKPNRCRKQPRRIDQHLYKERNGVERFGSKVKQSRRGAPRSEQKAVNFLAFRQVASGRVRLPEPGHRRLPTSCPQNLAPVVRAPSGNTNGGTKEFAVGKTSKNTRVSRVFNSGVADSGSACLGSNPSSPASCLPTFFP